MSASIVASRSRRVIAVTTAVLLLSLLVAPLTCFILDMRDYWVIWQAKTAGWRPWGAYELSVKECNYPPVVLYLMTLAEAARGALGVGHMSRVNWLLLKLPNLAAIGLGTLVLFRAARARLGERDAAVLALFWACSPFFFVNAALWAQWDVLMSLTLLLATIAFVRGRYVWWGVWMGVTLSMKVQAIFVLPAFFVGLLAVPPRRPGVAGTLGSSGLAMGRGIAGGILAAVLCFAPVAAARKLPQAAAVYTASVDTFPMRTISAWNVWTVANGVESRMLKRPSTAVNDDGRPVLASGPRSLTFKRLGQLLFAAYLVVMLAVLARRRRVADVVAAVPLGGVAMFMLCTQMHERYIGPPAALMVLWLPWARAWRIQAVYWAISAAANSLAVMYYMKYLGLPFSRVLYDGSVMAWTIANCLMFAWLTWLFLRPGPTAEGGGEPALL